MSTLHVVQFSGGIGSWAAAMRVAERHGTSGLVLLAADSGAEHPDLWRFVEDSSRYLGVKPVIVADGRTPFQVFEDVRFLGNSRLAPCSHHLKQIPCREWMQKNTDPANTVVYVGFDHTETRRITGTRKGWEPWQVEFHMCDEPHMTKEEMLQWASDVGITPPGLYDWADHNNCGGMCVRAGKKHWAKLWVNDPVRFVAAEFGEARIQHKLGKRVTILREQVAGEQRSLSLSEYRLRLEAEAGESAVTGQPLPLVTVLGTGELWWPRSERISDRYGTVSLTSHSDQPAVFNDAPTRQHGRLTAVVLAKHRSTHLGDLARGLAPTTPAVGEAVVLGDGVLFTEGGATTPTRVGVRPMRIDDGEDPWMDPAALFRCEGQTVRLEFRKD